MGMGLLFEAGATGPGEWRPGSFKMGRLHYS